MNNKEFISELAQRLGLTQKEVVEYVNTFSTALTERLTESDSLAVYGFGSFETVIKKERIALAPVTGKRLLIPPKRVVLFRPGGALKEKIKNMGAE